ncbi:TRAP transporter small permease [Stappia sp.]|uniref:TRAP transporter small permease n=1 Tax=Stappia sp. TaxID=1870903 RepID=UPI0025FED7AA|nr:TRAP transporter small permease [Stappia sp.]|tara:strand:- start:39 stop:554 length:516 start_codon:yes stop_codon:yes gene_type:complete
MSEAVRPSGLAARIRTGLSLVEASVAAFMLIVMVGCTVLQVVARFVFSTGLSWTDEVAMFSFIWAALMGAALVINTGGAHRIDAFVRLLPLPPRRVVLALVYVTILAALVLLAVYGVKLLFVVHFQKSSILRVPMSWIYAALPLSATLMLVSTLLDWRSHLGFGAPEGDHV